MSLVGHTVLHLPRPAVWRIMTKAVRLKAGPCGCLGPSEQSRAEPAMRRCDTSLVHSAWCCARGSNYCAPHGT